LGRKKKNKDTSPNIPKKDTNGLLKVVSARSPNQKELIKSIIAKDITFCVGPPGSGKTNLSVGLASLFLCKNKINKIIITRPIVEAGEKMGFLPGTGEEKIGPYLLPIYDELHYYMNNEFIIDYKAKHKIEVVPLAHMRGRNFHESFIILDEAQNATYEQLKMIITRIGMNSKMVINGDLQQSDLPRHARGGLALMLEKLRTIEEIGIVEFQNSDIVRHPIIGKILDCLEPKSHDTDKAQN
jgi:phosphate starvation-inducible PhoH-like protein